MGRRTFCPPIQCPCPSTLLKITMSSSEMYSKLALLQMEDGLKLIEHLSLTEGMKVLDLGCGTGYLASRAAALVLPGGKVVAVDPDKDRILLAQKQYGIEPNLLFSDGSSDEFPEDNYDAVYSNYVLHWVKDKEAVFKNVYRNLKNGCRFGLAYPEILSPTLKQLCELMDHQHERIVKEKFAFEPHSVYERIAHSVGFTTEWIQFTSREHSYPNVDTLIQWWFAVTHGAFSPDFVEQTAMEKFKAKYGDKPVKFDEPVVLAVLKK